jgi:hypothetical protein
MVSRDFAVPFDLIGKIIKFIIGPDQVYFNFIDIFIFKF